MYCKPKDLALVSSGPVTWHACLASSGWPSPLVRVIGSVVIDTHHPTDSPNPTAGTKGPIVIFRIFLSGDLCGRRWNVIGETGEKKKGRQREEEHYVQ